ncbi:MAG: Holliday junction resolvase RuvX [Candidatus Kapaibacterium sp.]
MRDETTRQVCRGQRIAAFDYGRSRVGWAVCDERHIVTTTKGVFLTKSATFWQDLLAGLQRERITVCLVGIPLRHDDTETVMLKACTEFADELAQRSGHPVFLADESFSSKRAVATMVSIGVKKSDRRDKKRTDEIAAAIILRDFLQELE